MASPATRENGVSARGSLAKKYSVFTLILIGWVSFTFYSWDLRHGSFEPVKTVLLSLIVVVTAAVVGRFTNWMLAKPLRQLQRGIESVSRGCLEPVRVSPTGDEIEYLGHSLNNMIEALAVSRREITEHQQRLEERIRERTGQLQEATQRAVDASRAKSEFLANVSHELRTPLVGVLGMLDIVLEENLRPSQREKLEIAGTCARSLLALVNDILDFSKIEAGKLNLEQIQFDLHGLVSDCAKTLLPRCREKRIALNVTIGEDVPAQVLGDPLRVRQILLNLLSNAVKFTEQGAVDLELRTRSPVGERLPVRFSVRDTGIGIPADKLNSIFKNFTQADGSTTRRYGGTGLGLAITRRLVEMQHGSISVEIQEGKGSVFHVELCFQPASTTGCELPRVTLADPHPCAPPQSARQAMVLVVEDNVINQKVAASILNNHGYRTVVARNGREALEQLERSAVDLVLMDVQMPEMDGITATTRIRANPRWRNLPVVALTARAMDEEREQCFEVGMNAFLAKPITSARLIETVQEYLAHGEKANFGGHQDQRAARADQPPPIDFEMVAHADSGEMHLLREMTLLFVQMAADRLQRLREALEQARFAQAATQVQKLSKAAERVGARQTGFLLQDLAVRIRQRDCVAALALLAAVDREIGRLRDWVEQNAGAFGHAYAA